MQTTPRESLESFLKAAIVFARIKLSTALNKSSERWSDEDVSVLLAIYSEDAKRRIPKLLLNAVSVAQQS